MTQTIRLGVPYDMEVPQYIIDRMAEIHPDVDMIVVPVSIDDDPLAEVPEGVLDTFYEDALSDGAIDAFLAPMDRVMVNHGDGVYQVAVLPRDEQCYAIAPVPLDDVPQGSRIHVCNPAVCEMVSEFRPDLKVSLERDGCDAWILPSSSVNDGSESHVLDRSDFVPAICQGAFSVLCRRQDADTRGMLSCLNDSESRMAVSVEISLMKLTGAVGIAPVGVSASVIGDAIHVYAVAYGYTPEPRRVDCYLPLDYVMDEVLGIAEYLVGKRDYIL